MILVLLDLKAAFNTISHDILLNRLDQAMGVRGKCLAWFRSYTTLHTKSEKVSYAVFTECDLCGKAHRTEQCWYLTKLTLNECREKVKQTGLCFRCLSKAKAEEVVVMLSC